MKGFYVNHALVGCCTRNYVVRDPGIERVGQRGGRERKRGGERGREMDIYIYI